MTRLAALEAALLDAFDPTHLAVYADELQRLGDPRGELIAIDLHIDAHGESPELAARRRELLAGLLGAAAAHPIARCKYGVLGLGVAEREALAVVDAVLLGPLGRYVGDIQLRAGPHAMSNFMVALAQQARPFLRTLALIPDGGALNARALRRAVGRMPRLDKLHVRARPGSRAGIPLVAFPTVRVLEVFELHSVAALTAPAHAPTCFPHVHALELAFSEHRDLERMNIVPASQFPALRRLDLSQCIYGAGDWIFRFLRTLAAAPKLEQLRVPAVMSGEQALNLQAALDRMPNLLELEIIGHYVGPRLHHPTAVIRWPTI